ncbi:MAG: DNA cytosine methyltransferase, partial [Bacteroidia bacterium]|nr:DNA cytosine methyltransferase [Bacteroidia bacterium]
MSNERVEAGAGANFKTIKGGKYLNALSLFSGIGGLDLAAGMAGIEVIGFCEIEPFPVEVLTKRFPGVPIFEDVRKLTAEVIRDRTGMDASQSIDVIFGGFPCQDLSQAGKQVGLTGARSGLWFEMLRVISELRPRYVLAENVRGAVNLALDTVYSNLVNEGYKVYPYVIPASAVGAPHQRERLFVVGVREDVHRQYTEAMENTGCELRQGSSEQREMGRETSEGIASDSEFSGGTLWPSPVASDGSCGGIISPDDTYVQKESGLFRKINRNGTDGSVGLARMVKLWPTPNVSDKNN